MTSLATWTLFVKQTTKQPTAFITTRKGFCYLTLKCGRHNFHVMRIRNYTLNAQDKRDKCTPPSDS